MPNLPESRILFGTVDNHTAGPPTSHYHQEYEIYYLTDGSCRYFIDNKTYSLSCGDFVVIPPGIIHKVIYDVPVYGRHLIHCSGDYIPASVLPHIDELVYFSPSPAITDSIQNIYRQLRHAYELQDEFSSDTVRCCVATLMLLMVKNPTAHADSHTGSSFVEKAVRYIRAHYNARPTLKDTANHCAVSPEHLSRMFRKETGFGFSEYLNLYRLKKAESILKSRTSLSISQVAMQCGFNDSNYFSCSFKKMYGISPSALKKQHNTDNNYPY